MSGRNKGLTAIRRIIVFIVVLIVLGYAAVALIHMQIDIQAQEKELAELQRKLYELNIENEKLERLIDEDSLATVEAIARSEFNLSYPDEKIYYFIASSE